MFDKEELNLAVDLQRRSYKLLRWLSEAVTRGFIGFDAAHEYSSLPISTAKWIESHYENIPPDARPKTEDLKRFSAFFSTYLENTFELVSKPRKMRSRDWCCSFCSVMVDAPNLKTKKTTRSDHKKARKMRISAIKQFALETGVTIESEVAESLADDAFLRETTALIAYGNDLRLRLKGISTGPPVLVLWRGFAWTKEGSPKRDFVLNAELFLEAQEQLRDLMSKHHLPRVNEAKRDDDNT